MRFRRELIPLFFAYAAAGSLLGVVAFATIVLVGRVMKGEVAIVQVPSAVSSAVDSGVFLWLIGLIPSGLSALIFCIAMTLWPRIYESRTLRVLVASVVGGATTGFVFLTISIDSELTLKNFGELWLFIPIGALSAMLLAYRWPKSVRANAA